MRCLCPKCNSNIELDQIEIPEDGSFNKCPECSAGFLVKKASFASRSLHKGTGITCAECGSTPGASVYCQSCHAIYPDFYVTESSSAAKNQFGKIRGFLDRLNRLSGKSASTTQYTDYGIKSTAGTKGLRLPGQPAQIAAVLAIVVLALGVGGFFWYQDRVETGYAENYVRALYGIKSTTDFDLKTCNKIAADWRASMAQNPPQLAATETTFMARAGKDVENMMKAIGEPPEKFMASKDNISKLYAAHTKLHSFALKPSGTIDSYTATVTLLDDEFKSSAKTVKTGLPEKISAKLEESKKKYKALQDF